jgi:starch phosphorylase
MELTIGTLDGANIEIRDQVGAENFFIFGKTAIQIAQLRDNYHPWELLATMPLVQEAIDLIEKGHFSNGDCELFKPTVHNLVNEDPYFVLADFNDYLVAQGMVSRTWSQRAAWNRKSLLNIARSGFFSSDRSIYEYSSRIWQVQPLSIAMAPGALSEDQSEDA